MKHAPQFAGQRNVIIVAALATLTLGAMLFIWRTSDQRQRAQILALMNQLSSTRMELQSAKSRAEFAPPAMRSGVTRGVLAEMQLPFVNLRSAKITAGDAGFANSSFIGGDLSDCVISAGDGAFQRTRFDGANLANAELTGGVGAFQLASFEDADLSGATLTGVGAAFQCMSLANAKLLGTRIKGGGSFHGVNIDGTQFAGADLSSIDQRSLESSYFQTSPTYDDLTRFPFGFDPVARRWKQVARVGE